MTNSSPPNPTPPSEEQRIRQQIRRRTREETVDEWLAILIAFGTIGAILLWTLGFRKNNFVTTRLGNDSVASSGEQVVENFNINREPSGQRVRSGYLVCRHLGGWPQRPRPKARFAHRPKALGQRV